MKLSEPTVGPIIGHTTADQCRIFLRGAEERQHGGLRRCFAAIRWRPKGTDKWSRPLFNKLSPNFDLTGVFVLKGLVPDTEYEYQTGWFYADASFETVEKWTATQVEWRTELRQFKSGTHDTQQARNYIVGSCRYLLRLFGGTIFDDRGDKTFQSVLLQIEQQNPVDALLMIGDQIYADDLNVLGADIRLDEFLRRYRMAFSQRYIRQLMARVPTYMILDDHEIEDNWPSKATKRDFVTLYPQAIHAYQIYQCSHSPLFRVVGHRIDGTLTHFWYTFTDGCADWFIMDVRTERIVSTPNRRMISREQLEALLGWLSDGSGRIKFAVTPVPLFPDLNFENDDKWGAFPEQRLAILDHIEKHAIRKVVFVSGDVHCSFVSRLTCPTNKNFMVHSIVSSSFFWPYPHTAQSGFKFDQPLDNTGQREYVAKLVSPLYSDDNFARLEAKPDEVRVTYYERKGGMLGKPIRLKL